MVLSPLGRHWRKVTVEMGGGGSMGEGCKVVSCEEKEAIIRKTWTSSGFNTPCLSLLVKSSRITKHVLS